MIAMQLMAYPPTQIELLLGPFRRLENCDDYNYHDDDDYDYDDDDDNYQLINLSPVVQQEMSLLY